MILRNLFGTLKNTFRIGDGLDTHKVIEANNGDENRPALRYNYATSKWQFTNNGADWSDMGSGESSFYEYVFIPIEWPEDGASAPDAAEKITHTNGKVSVRKFAGDSSQDVLIPWRVPDDMVVADGLFFQVLSVITEATGPTNEGVSFKLSGYCSGDGDDITGTFGDEIESKKTAMTYAQYVTFDTVLSGKVTVTDLAQGELAMLKLYRDHDDADDDYEQKLGVYGILLKIKRTMAG